MRGVKKGEIFFADRCADARFSAAVGLDNNESEKGFSYDDFYAFQDDSSLLHHVVWFVVGEPTRQRRVAVPHRRIGAAAARAESPTGP